MTIGVVLAGGSSTRMGRPKAGLPFEGRTFLDRVASALLAAAGDVLVVGGPSTDPWPHLPDDGDRGRGPLSGIVTALRNTGDDVLAVAVDHPLVDAATLRRLTGLSTDRCVVPLSEDIPQITCAWYPTTALEPFEVELSKGGFVRRALDTMNPLFVPEEEWQAWGESGDSWVSVDTPEEYERLLREE